MICAFFGHRDTPESIRPQLRQSLITLIEDKKIYTFYIGDKGTFDSIVLQELKSLQKNYPYIKYTVILSKLPDKNTNNIFLGDEENTMFPAELEKVPPRFKIDRRNMWLINNADIFITYVTHSWGGAAKCKEIAQKRGKCVINLN